MAEAGTQAFSDELIAELERRFFWWEPVGTQPRSDARVIAQATSFAGFADVRQMEQRLGYERLIDTMLAAQPGWIDERSWEFWRGRLMRATGREIPDVPPCRSLDVGPV
jgi:hypothetical protein